MFGYKSDLITVRDCLLPVVEVHRHAEIRLKPMAGIQYDHVVGTCRPTPDRDHLKSSVLGVVHRVCGRVPTISLGNCKRLRLTIHRIFDRYLLPMEEGDILSTMDYIDSLDKSADFKANLKKYAEENGTYGTLFHNPMTHRQSDCFIKDECYDDFKHQRNISGQSKKDIRNDIAGKYGRFIKSIEHFVYKRLPCNIKHLNLQEKLDKVSKLPDSGICTSDYSSFESSHRARIGRFVFLPFLQRLLGPLMEWRTIERDSTWIIVGFKKLKYKNFVVEIPLNVEMSGDSHTSLFNWLYNYCVWVTILLDKGYTFENIEEMLVLEGDDVICDKRDAKLSAGDFTAYGLLTKMETDLDLRAAGFCQLYFEGNTVNADPFKKLNSVFRIPQRYLHARRSTHLRLLRAQAISLLCLHAGAPVCTALARALLRLTRSHTVLICELNIWLTPQNVVDCDWRMKQFTPVSDNARLLVERVFGMTIEQQLIVEKMLDEWNGGPLDLPVTFPDVWTHFYNTMTTIKT